MGGSGSRRSRPSREMRKKMNAENVAPTKSCCCAGILNVDEIEAMRAAGAPKEYLTARQPLVNLLDALAKRNDYRQIVIQKGDMVVSLNRKALLSKCACFDKLSMNGIFRVILVISFVRACRRTSGRNLARSKRKLTRHESRSQKLWTVSFSPAARSPLSLASASAPSALMR